MIATGLYEISWIDDRGRRVLKELHPTNSAWRLPGGQPHPESVFPDVWFESRTPKVLFLPDDRESDTYGWFLDRLFHFHLPSDETPTVVFGVSVSPVSSPLKGGDDNGE